MIYIAVYILIELDLQLCACLCAAAISAEAVTSGSAVVQQPLTHTQTALITTATTTSVTQVQHDCLLFFFASGIFALFHAVTFLVLKS